MGYASEAEAVKTGALVPAGNAARFPSAMSGFPKAHQIIQCHDKDLRAFDRKLLNVILARSQAKLVENPNMIFYAQCSDLRRELGWGQHKDNQEISHSLLKLQKTIIELDYLSHEGRRTSRVNLLIQTDVPEREGLIYWKWNPEIAGLLGSPEHFARLFLQVVASLSGEVSLRLYENLAIYAPGSMEYKLDQLRVLLAAGHQPLYKSWNEFSRRLLQPALADVNKNAPFNASMVPIRGDRNRVVAVKFVMTLKDGWDGSLLEKKIEPRDTLVPNLKVHAAQIKNLAARLSERSMERFAKEFSGVALQELALIWAKGVLTRGRKIEDVKRPSVAFESWLRAVHPLFRQGKTSQDVIWAATTMAYMNTAVRGIWIDIARRKAGVTVPDAALDNIHAWIEAILDEIRTERAYAIGPDGEEGFLTEDLVKKREKRQTRREGKKAKQAELNF